MHFVPDRQPQAPPFPPAPPRVGIVGCSGYNSVHRVVPAFAGLNGGLRSFGYDLRPPPDVQPHIPFRLVRGADDLPHRLRADRLDVALFETTDEDHPHNLHEAVEAGVPWILCEKCLADRSDAVAGFVPAWQRLAPRQRIQIVDHYLMLGLVLELHANIGRWLGEVRRLRVLLLESQGIPPHQVRSHAQGVPMGNFFHHAIALAVAVGGFAPEDLLCVEAWRACHPDSPVPGTYLAGRFASTRTGTVVLDGVVGKYMDYDRKLVHVLGTRGEAWLDRDRNELRVVSEGRPFTVKGPVSDTGYGALALAIATGKPLLTLLDVGQALQILRLLERMHAIAQDAHVYEPRPRHPDYVSDWQLGLPADDGPHRPRTLVT